MSGWRFNGSSLGSGLKHIFWFEFVSFNISSAKSWIEISSDKIILGADCLDQKIAIQGWQEESDKEVIEFIKEFVSKGISYVICTDISKDGMLQAPLMSLWS